MPTRCCQLVVSTCSKVQMKYLSSFKVALLTSFMERRQTIFIFSISICKAPFYIMSLKFS